MSFSITGVVKYVQSGDTLVIKHPKKQIEKYINLADVEAPRFNKKETDESYGFAARELIRKKCVGNQVEFTIKYSNPKRKIDYCEVKVGDVSLSKLLLQNGLATLSEKAIQDGDSELIELEAAAKQKKKGIHSGSKDLPPIQRNDVEVTQIFKTLKNKTLDVIVEQVISGSTIKVILPTFEVVLVSFTGVKTPGVKIIEKDGEKEKKFEAYSKDATAFTENALLGKDVTIVFEGLDTHGKYTDILGTVLLEDKKTFSEQLFAKGLAKVDDNTVGNSKYIQQFRDAEKEAQSKKSKIWKDYKPIESTLKEDEKNAIPATLVDIISGDTVKLILENKEEIVSLSNVRSRCDDKDASIVNHFNLEAKEFLRKKLVGNKKIMVKIDYRRTLEKTKGDKKIEEERRYVTILVNNKSIAVELVAAGLATVQKRQDQEKSEAYDNLLRADAEARKTNKGMHGQINKKKGFRSNVELILKENEKNPTKIIADASKIALTNKDKKIKAVVVRVFNGARFKLYLPDENVTVLFSLDGVSAPSFGKAPKPFSKESLLFSNENLYLRDVNIIVDRIDSVKGLTFIGTLFLNDKDYAIDLLNEGLGTMTKSAAKLKSYTAYQKAEIASRTAKKNIFSIEQEERKPQVTNSKNAVVQGNPQVFQVRVTEITDASHLYLQTPDSAEFLGKVDAEMKLLNLDESQPDESFKPQVKEYVLAKFSEDKNWYRGQVLSIEKSTYTVFYIDFGNKEKVKVTSLRKLAPDSELAKIKPQAKEAFLAYVHFHHTNYKSESLSLVKDFCQGEDLVARHEYSLGKNIYVSLFDSKGKYNLNADLIVNGFAFVTSNYHLTEGPTKELFAKQIEELKKKEQEARQEKSGLWQDGDVYGSDEE